MPSTQRERVTIGGHRIGLTSLDRVVYPDAGATKRDVINEVEAVADSLIVYTAGRACTRKRWPTGVGTAGAPRESFFHKNLDDAAPSWIRNYAIRHADHTNRYPLVNDAATAVWFAQHGTLEFHVPQWRFGPRGRHEHPDRLVLDLDPGPGVTMATLVAVARAARDVLAEEGLESVPVTSGSKGIHLYAPLDGGRSVDGAHDLAHRLVTTLEEDDPSRVTANIRKAEREGRVLVDWSQNNGVKTTVAPFSPRGRPGATVALPREWDELDGTLEQATLGLARERAVAGADPLAALLEITKT